jgi:hypothetical protein
MGIKGPRGVELLQGELLTLAASAARTAGANGTAVQLNGERRRLLIVCSITASATDAGDTADIYVDYSLDNVTWFNAIHFTQHAGNGAAIKEFAALNMAAAPAATVTNVTADAASGAVRPYVFGPYVRARWAIVDSGDANQSCTFSVTAWAE